MTGHNLKPLQNDYLYLYWSIVIYHITQFTSDLICVLFGTSLTWLVSILHFGVRNNASGIFVEISMQHISIWPSPLKVFSDRFAVVFVSDESGLRCGPGIRLCIYFHIYSATYSYCCMYLLCVYVLVVNTPLESSDSYDLYLRTRTIELGY